MNKLTVYVCISGLVFIHEFCTFALRLRKMVFY